MAVKIPKSVAEAFEEVWFHFDNKSPGLYKKHLLLVNWNIINDYSYEKYKIIRDYTKEPENMLKYIKAIVDGYYEVELAPEEEIEELYRKYLRNGSYDKAAVIENVLEILNIKIKGVNK